MGRCLIKDGAAVLRRRKRGNVVEEEPITVADGKRLRLRAGGKGVSCKGSSDAVMQLLLSVFVTRRFGSFADVCKQISEWRRLQMADMDFPQLLSSGKNELRFLDTTLQIGPSAVQLAKGQYASVLKVKIDGKDAIVKVQTAIEAARERSESVGRQLDEARRARQAAVRRGDKPEDVALSDAEIKRNAKHSGRQWQRYARRAEWNELMIHAVVFCATRRDPAIRSCLAELLQRNTRLPRVPKVLIAGNDGKAVAIDHLGIAPRTTYVGMEAIDMSLKELLAKRNGRSDEAWGKQVLDVLQQTTALLACLQQRMRFMHRDLHTENVMLKKLAGDKHQVYLIDFGFSRLATEINGRSARLNYNNRYGFSFDPAPFDSATDCLVLLHWIAKTTWYRVSKDETRKAVRRKLRTFHRLLHAAPPQPAHIVTEQRAQRMLTRRGEMQPVIQTLRAELRDQVKRELPLPHAFYYSLGLNTPMFSPLNLLRALQGRDAQPPPGGDDGPVCRTCGLR